MMTKSLALFPLLLLSFGFVSVATQPSSEESASHAQEKTELQKAMQTFKAAQRSLKKLIGDPAANEEALLETLRGMEASAMAALAETPTQPEGLAGKELALFHVGFKLQVAKLLEQILAMQGATLRGDSDALKSGYDELGKVKMHGHETYRDF